MSGGSALQLSVVREKLMAAKCGISKVVSSQPAGIAFLLLQILGGFCLVGN